MNYKVLIFDADGTLFDFVAAEEQAFKQMLADIHIEFTEQLFNQYLKANQSVWQELEQGLITQEELKYKRFLGFNELAAINKDAKEMAISYMNHLSNASILYPEALKLIQELSQDYTITILTNGLREVQDKRIRRSILSPYLRDVVISDEEGIAKPDPRIIDLALKRINHQKKSDVMIIGDSLTSDIQGGQNASITTVWFNKEQSINTSKIRPDYEIARLEDLKKIL